MTGKRNDDDDDDALTLIAVHRARFLRMASFIAHRDNTRGRTDRFIPRECNPEIKSLPEINHGSDVISPRVKRALERISPNCSVCLARFSLLRDCSSANLRSQSHESLFVLDGLLHLLRADRETDTILPFHCQMFLAPVCFDISKSN